MTIIDLTRPFSNEPLFRLDAADVPLVSDATRYTGVIYQLHLDSMCSTYIDLPGHIRETNDGQTAENVPPERFFRMPARMSINVGETLGFGEKYGWDWSEFTIPLIFLSGDTSLFSGENWYTGVGSGVGLQAQQNERLGAKLLFEFRLFYGYRINEKWNIELYAQHFSNANTAKENHSYAFFGLGVNRNF